MSAADFAAWDAAGRRIDVGGLATWLVDLPATEEEQGDPLFILHGFPTCSYDWRHVLQLLRPHRRAVLLDYPGFGFSDKPDHRYSIRMHADAAQAAAVAAGLERVVLVTHDLGNSVGGELLARSLEGALPFAVSQRIITNGSIYIDLAQLTAGQQMLLDADDARFDLAALGIDPGDAFKGGLAGVFSPDHPASDEELADQWMLASRENGHQLLTRTIRYVEDRRAEEHRFTGAIENHPAPLGIIWGDVDPVAVHAMSDRLLGARPDARRITLEGVGHYPMVEDPRAFADAAIDLLAPR